MKTDFPQLFFSERKELRNWLKKNQSRSKGIWLVYFKKNTGKPSVTYEEAVEEALCFGWIDSTVKKLDEDRYMQKFTPRNDNSNWSELNKKRVEKLIKEKKMDASGLSKIIIAKQNGKWEKASGGSKEYILSEPILKMIKSNSNADAFYQTLPAGLIKQYTAWIMSAVKQETRIKRTEKLLMFLEKHEKLTFI